MVYKLFIRKYNVFSDSVETFVEFVIAENKKELWSYIGYLYSNEICHIERIDYFAVTDSDRNKEYLQELHNNKVININKRLKRYVLV